MFQDDLAERTLPPTERRRREARARGEVARSPELTAAIILLAFCGLIRALGFNFTTTLATWMRAAISRPQVFSIKAESGIAMLTSTIDTMTAVIWPILVVLLICGLIANLVQTGLLWTPSALLPRVRFADIASGFRLGDVIRQTIKLLILGVTLWWALSSQDWQYRKLAVDDTLAMLAVPAENIITTCLTLACVLLLFAAFDYGLRFWQLQQRLMMTFDERRSEQREDELDPRLKRRLRSGRPSGEIVSSSRID